MGRLKRGARTPRYMGVPYAVGFSFDEIARIDPEAISKVFADFSGALRRMSGVFQTNRSLRAWDFARTDLEQPFWQAVINEGQVEELRVEVTKEEAPVFKFERVLVPTASVPALQVAARRAVLLENRITALACRESAMTNQPVQPIRERIAEEVSERARTTVYSAEYVLDRMEALARARNYQPQPKEGRVIQVNRDPWERKLTFVVEAPYEWPVEPGNTIEPFVEPEPEPVPQPKQPTHIWNVTLGVETTPGTAVETLRRLPYVRTRHPVGIDW